MLIKPCGRCYNVAEPINSDDAGNFSAELPILLRRLYYVNVKPGLDPERSAPKRIEMTVGSPHPFASVHLPKMPIDLLKNS